MTTHLDRLIRIMARLRDPDGGCPWDVEQTFATIVPHTIEEAYEVAEAIEHGDIGALRDELGDLLLQVVFHAQMAREEGHFDFDDVSRAISDKLVRRHPHVFGDEVVADSQAQTRAWERHKAAERDAGAADSVRAVSGAARDTESVRASVLDGVAVALPALLRAQKLQNRAARVGFDWDAAKGVLDKIEEEIAELRHEMDGARPSGAARGTENGARLADELGDILFACANLARKLGIDPESALRGGNGKFERRFRAMEALAARQGRRLEDLGLERMEALWQSVKAEEKAVARPQAVEI
ncbi:MAG: nucleoside triphosphate pyrophosphohydrolase [Rhodospirillales bacterium]|nr:nucleoside triphosphate pyrophosphohydrolase [Rhodospirillales bacterium]